MRAYFVCLNDYWSSRYGRGYGRLASIVIIDFLFRNSVAIRPCWRHSIRRNEDATRRIISSSPLVSWSLIFDFFQSIETEIIKSVDGLSSFWFETHPILKLLSNWNFFLFFSIVHVWSLISLAGHLSSTQNPEESGMEFYEPIRNTWSSKLFWFNYLYFRKY